jgi:hypothetical protein
MTEGSTPQFEGVLIADLLGAAGVSVGKPRDAALWELLDAWRRLSLQQRAAIVAVARSVLPPPEPTIDNIH